MYQLVFRSRFERVFKKLDIQTQRLVLSELEELAQNPFHHSQVKSIAGVKQKAFRLRVDRWRIIYLVLTKQQTLEVIDLFLRKGRDDYANVF